MTVPNSTSDLEKSVLSSSHVETTSNPEDVATLGDTLTVRTPEQEKLDKRLRLKIDLYILPLVTLAYFLATMDRGDIGNAAVAGMTKELRLTANQYSTCASLFYVGYIVFQLPGDLFLRKITPPIQIGCALIVWGTFCTVLCLAKSYSAVAGLRVAVGASEAFVQAAPVYLALWYKRNELALRTSFVLCMLPFAGVINGVIAFGLEKNLDGERGWLPWRWLFLIEGVITVAFGLLMLVALPPVPEKVKRGFNEKERELAALRSREAHNEPNAAIAWRRLLDLFKDPKIYFLVVLYCCTNCSLACFGNFLPIIIKALGYSSITAQVYTIPVYVCTAASLLIFGSFSDHLKKRGFLLCIAFLVASVGWLILLLSHSQRLSFAGTFLVGIGTYPCIGLSLAWMNSNIIGFTQRAGGLATINMIGQCFAIIGTKVYSDPPHYYRGNGFVLGMTLLGALTAATFVLYLHKQNLRKKQEQFSNDPSVASRRALGAEQIGDKHPDFFYYL